MAVPLTAAVVCTATALLATSGLLGGASVRAAGAQSCTGVDAVADSFSYLVNGVPVVGLEDHVHSGDKVVAVFSVVPGCTTQVSFVAYTASHAGFSRQTAGQEHVFSSDTGIFTGGPHALTITNPPCFFEDDFVVGPVLTTLGPANSHNFYGDQHRGIDSENGGTVTCSLTTPTPTPTPTATPTSTPTSTPTGEPTSAPTATPTGGVSGITTTPNTGSDDGFAVLRGLAVIGAGIAIGAGIDLIGMARRRRR